MKFLARTLLNLRKYITGVHSVVPAEPSVEVKGTSCVRIVVLRPIGFFKSIHPNS